MLEKPQPPSRQSRPDEQPISSDVQVDVAESQSNQLTWEPVGEVTKETAGKHTKFLDVHPNWGMVNRRSLARASCRNEVWRLLHPREFIR